MKVVIPASGHGVRFHPLSLVVPKELMPLGAKPLLHHALDEAARAAFDAAVVVITSAKREIASYLEYIRPPLPTEIVVQAEADGPGGAVLAAAQVMNGEPFGVLLPDDVVPAGDHWARLLALHGATGAAALCVRRVDRRQQDRFGMTECRREGGRLAVQRLVEKPVRGQLASDLAVFGRYVLTPGTLGALRSLRRRPLEITDGLEASIRRGGRLYAVLHRGRIFDCGTPDAYTTAAAGYARHVARAADSAPS